MFGGTGDLAMRKILPGLYQRDLDGQLPAESRIVGAARTEIDRDGYVAQAEKALRRFVEPERMHEEKLASFLARLDYLPLDATRETGWLDLAGKLGDAPDRIRVFYLATAPDLFGPICRKLGSVGVATPNARVVLEKPVGRDLASAHAINAEVGEVFQERQIFRIDHYLGKETVQNLMALRFANTLFEPLWNHAGIDNVQITVAETVGLESRAAYYDRSGALRDMVQNHILQLLCLVAMEPPAELEADAVRDEKLKVLRSLAPIVDGAVAQKTVRGQYRAGAMNGQAVRGYLEELGGPNESQTETFVAIKAEVRNWRWAGVPFYLRTGKRLPARVSEIVVQFKPLPHSIFPKGAGAIQPNRLDHPPAARRGHQAADDEQGPRPGRHAAQADAAQPELRRGVRVGAPDAYERLLLDVVRGNATLFMRKDEVEAAWALGRPDHRRLGRGGGALPVPVPGRLLGPHRIRGAHRPRRADLVRRHALKPSPRGATMTINPRLADITRRIAERSADSRAAYLERIRRRRPARPARAKLSCANFAHAFAACGDGGQGRPEGRGAAQHRHRLRLQRHALGPPAAGALPRADQAGGARGRRDGPVRRRRAGHVRRRHPGPARAWSCRCSPAT